MQYAKTISNYIKLYQTETIENTYMEILHTIAQARKRRSWPWNQRWGGHSEVTYSNHTNIKYNQTRSISEGSYNMGTNKLHTVSTFRHVMKEYSINDTEDYIWHIVDIKSMISMGMGKSVSGWLSIRIMWLRGISNHSADNLVSQWGVLWSHQGCIQLYSSDAKWCFAVGCLQNVGIHGGQPFVIERTTLIGRKS